MLFGAMLQSTINVIINLGNILVETINQSSNDWFKIHVDRKELKKLYKRSDLAGFKHIITYFVSRYF